MLDSASFLHGENYQLVGSFIDIPPLASTFTTPLFEIPGDNYRDRYIQIIDSGGFIAGFEKALEVHDDDVLLASEIEITCRTGDAGVFGFFDHHDGSAIYGNRTLVSEFLSENVDRYLSNPYTAFEVLSFLGRAQEAKELFRDEEALPNEQGSTAPVEIDFTAVWQVLALNAGEFIGQMTDQPIKAVNVLLDGEAQEQDQSSLSAEVLTGVMRAANPDIAKDDALKIAEARGIEVSVVAQAATSSFRGYIKVTVVTDSSERSVALSSYDDGKPRLIQIKGVNLDAVISQKMLYVSYEDAPGVVGAMLNSLVQHGSDLENLDIGRSHKGGEAICMLNLYEDVPSEALSALTETGLFVQIRPLSFSSSQSR